MRGGRWVLVALAVTVVPFNACMDGPGDDAADPPDTTAPTAEQTAHRVATWFTNQSEPTGLQFTADEADCAARGVVDGLGVARIEELRSEAANEVGSTGDGVGLLQEPPLEPDEADVVYTAMTGCIDFTAQVTDVLVATGKPPDAARCMAERLVDTEVPRRAIMAAETDPELMAEINAALTTVATACAG